MQLERDDAGQADLGEVAANLKRSESLAAVEDGIRPFPVMAVRARKCLPDFFCFAVVSAANEFLLVVQFDVAL